MIGKATTVFFLLFIFSINIIHCFEITCKDESGEIVDWFVVYKIPKLQKITDGLSYAFVTSNKQSGNWTLSKRRISDRNSLFGATVLPLYSKSGKEYTKILYSDQTPDGKSYAPNAHAKGVIAMDTETGFWLTHSIPKYPTPLDEAYKYPSSGDDNGQTALCISFSTAEEGEKIIDHLLVLKSKIFSDVYDEKTMEVVPNLEKLQDKKWSKESFKQSSIKSLKGNEFITFAKSPKVVDDLYGNHVAPFIKSGVLVESWRKGSGTKMPTNCHGYNIMNVNEVNLKFASGQSSGDWKYTKDHAKWLISEDQKKAFVCVSDLNRMMSQNKRGGGAVCFHNERVWKSFRESIAGLEPCSKN